MRTHANLHAEGLTDEIQTATTVVDHLRELCNFAIANALALGNLDDMI